MTVSVKSATVSEAKKALEANSKAIMIDVREQTEIDEVSTNFAKTFSMSQINPETFDHDCGLLKDQPILVLCRSGGRSMRVANALVEVGFKDVTNVSGGITAWEAEGLPVVRSRQA